MIQDGMVRVMAFFQIVRCFNEALRNILRTENNQKFHNIPVLQHGRYLPERKREDVTDNARIVVHDFAKKIFLCCF